MRTDMNTLTFGQIKMMYVSIIIKQEMILKHSPLKSGLPDDPNMIISFIKLMTDDFEYTTKFIADLLEYTVSNNDINEKQLDKMMNLSNEHIKSIASELLTIHDMIANA